MWSTPSGTPTCVLSPDGLRRDLADELTDYYRSEQKLGDAVPVTVSIDIEPTATRLAVRGRGTKRKPEVTDAQPDEDEMDEEIELSGEDELDAELEQGCRRLNEAVITTIRTLAPHDIPTPGRHTLNTLYKHIDELITRVVRYQRQLMKPLSLRPVSV